MEDPGIQVDAAEIKAAAAVLARAVKLTESIDVAAIDSGFDAAGDMHSEGDAGNANDIVEAFLIAVAQNGEANMADHLDNIGKRMRLRDGSVTDTALAHTGLDGTHCLTARCGDKHWLWSPEGWWSSIGFPSSFDLIEPAE